MKKIIFYLFCFSTCAVYGQNFKRVFKKYDVEGSTTIYNPNKRTWLYTDSLDAIRQSLPGATFHIVNSCIALETDTLKTENELIKWDGKKSSWYIGYVEMKDKTFYFATRITKPASKNNPAFAKAAKEITMNILKQIKAIN